MSEDTSLARIARLLDVALLAQADDTPGPESVDLALVEVTLAAEAIRPDDLAWLHDVATAYAVDDATWERLGQVICETAIQFNEKRGWISPGRSHGWERIAEPSRQQYREMAKAVIAAYLAGEDA